MRAAISRALGRLERYDQLAVATGRVYLGPGQICNRRCDSLHAFRTHVNDDTGDVQFFVHREFARQQNQPPVGGPAMIWYSQTRKP